MQCLSEWVIKQLLGCLLHKSAFNLLSLATCICSACPEHLYFYETCSVPLCFIRFIFHGTLNTSIIQQPRSGYCNNVFWCVFQVPLFIPALFSFTCLFMVALSLYADPVNTGIGFAITLTGVPAYYLFIIWDKKPTWFRRLLGE